jgi:L-asparaginase
VTLPISQELPEVAFLATYAGDDGRFVRHAVDSGMRAIVLQAVGAGNVNADVFKAVKYALSKDVVVAITSRVAHGMVYPVYGDEGGGLTLQKAGAILAGDLDGPKARLLLMPALDHVTDSNELARLFRQARPGLPQ